jgi:hypothetical protein
MNEIVEVALLLILYTAQLLDIKCGKIDEGRAWREVSAE